MASEKLSSRGQAWFCTTGLPTDVVIEVGEMSFHLHKFPLMSKSRKVHHLITEREQNPKTQRGEDDDGEGGEEGIEAESEAAEEEEEEEEDFPHICLPEFPGGVEAFEAAAKFCYGVKIELTASNVVPLRCAAEYLDMTEDFAEDNLVARTERFLAQSVLRSVRDAAGALKSCERLLPQAEDLGLVQRCVDAIAARASGTDLNSLFGWPVPEAGKERALAVVAGAAEQSTGGSNNSSAWFCNGTDNGARRKGGIRYSAGSGFHDSWFEDLSALSLPIYKRVISAMKAKDLRPELIEGSIITYAKRSIPGLSRSNRNHAAATPLPSPDEQRELLETLITNLPQEKSSGLLATRLLSGLLRTVNILHASADSRTALERKIGSQLDRAALDDLLMPSYSYLVETLYDVDCVGRIVGYFLGSLEEERRGAVTADSDDNDEEEDRCVAEPPAGDDDNSRLLAVGKLVDGYLSEIASDANLKLDKFCDLALALPDHARVFDDGLYRAVDVYLKAHPRLTEEEKEKVCGVMDCQKLTLEACTHAAQNERLPLRAVVQVLFFEQLQLRRAIAGTLMNAEEDEEAEEETAAAAAAEEDEVMAVPERGRRTGRRGREGTWRSAVRENQVLRLDMDSMRSRVMGLEKECSRMRKALEKIDHRGGAAAMAAAAGSWGSLTRRFGCKFSTQVCDTQQQQHHRTVAAPRRPRIEYSSP